MDRTDSSPLPSIRENEDAIPLHSQPDRASLKEHDNDAPELANNNDLPPRYDDVSADTTLLPRAAPAMSPRLLSPYPHTIPSGVEFFLDSRLDNDPELLEENVLWWADTAPQLKVRIYGSHWDAYKDRNIIDFDISINLSPYLYSDAANRVSWRELRIAHLPSRNPDVERGIEAINGGTSLTRLCRRYCSIPTGFKKIDLQRRVVGFDEERFKRKLESVVRATDYLGNLKITFSVEGDKVTVLNKCRTNRLVLETWAIVLLTLTLMIFLVLPYITFRTEQFGVVIEWPFSRPGRDGRKQYVSLSEDQWCEEWSEAIKNAVLERRRGTMDQRGQFGWGGNVNP